MLSQIIDIQKKQEKGSLKKEEMNTSPPPITDGVSVRNTPLCTV